MRRIFTELPTLRNADPAIRYAMTLYWTIYWFITTYKIWEYIANKTTFTDFYFYLFIYFFQVSVIQKEIIKVVKENLNEENLLVYVDF